MASSHAPARRTVPRLLVGLVAAGGLTLTALPAASAAPGDPATSQEAAALVAAKAHDLEVVTEQFNEVRERLRTSQDAAARAAGEVAAAEAALATARDRVRSVARSAWTGDRLTTLSAMLSSESADELMDRVGTLQTIADHNNGVLGSAQEATEDAGRARAAALAAESEAQALVDRVAGQKADLDRQVARFQAEYDRLAAEEQRAAQEAAERHAAEQAAQQTAERAAAPERASRAAAPRPAAAAPAAPVVASSAAAQAAVDTAMAQRGDPYVWAAAGPNAFDCSGLVQYAYAAAGVSLPHSSRIQSTMGRAVSRADLQPGDLVFFYSPVSHVGIYVGNGQMVHASTYGQPVKVASIDSMGGYNSARRIAG
ncbi:C40 family peptidase [Geodermatophilus sp. CPCC 206100]|uniref:C40 family peptidase n=1 Tax=Geodermatophilus sp. CPCC 206100 TaxID=3020054 RepID=UPI003B006617